MISVIIVNYKTYDLTHRTIEKLLQSDIEKDIEVIVVDNCSNDGSIEKLKIDFDDVIFIINDMNYGFAKANNIGIEGSRGNYILLLNSDVEVYPNTISKMLNFLEADEKIGAVGPKLLLPDGSLDHTCKRGFPTPEASLYYFLGFDKKYPDSKRYGKYRMTYVDEDETAEVDSLVGAFMLMPRSVMDKAGLLDEKFFMYGEDIDLCYRIKEAGYKVFYYPESGAIHYKGGSSSKRSYKLIYEFHRAMILFYNKHYVKKYNFLITIIVYIGIVSMMSLKILVNFFKVKKND